MESAMYCPIIIGSDKTIVSVATGHIEYHPFYISPGVHNTVQQAHCNAVAPAAFLVIPKGECTLQLHFFDPTELHVSLCDWKYDNDPAFLKFKCQPYHDSIATILKTLQLGMQMPVVCHCPDGHFCHVIYDLGTYIADYPEQGYFAGIVQNWCSK